MVATLPFEWLPRRMKIEFIYFMVLWLNAFPVKSGISKTFSPRELLLRWRLDYKKHCRVEPGTYCKVHDKPVPTNTMTPRTHEAIALGPTRNLQGSVKFYCMKTGWVLKRRSFTPMLMLARVIRRMNSIGARERQRGEFRFLNCRNEPYEWTDKVPEDDAEFQGLLDENEDTAMYPDISAELPGVALEDDEQDFQTVTADPEPEFQELAGAALHNAGIDAAGAIRRARENDLSQAQGPPLMQAQGPPLMPPLFEANDDELVYELTFDIPDVGLLPPDDDPGEFLGDESDDTLIEAVPGADDKTAAVGR